MSKLNKLENQFATELRPWLFRVFFPTLNKSAGIEYKAVTGGTFNIKDWKKKEPQQSIRLNDCMTSEGAYFKIPDSGRETKDFDAYYICNGYGFLFIWFDKYKDFFVLPIQDVNKMGNSVKYSYLKEHYEANKLIKKEKKKLPTF